MENTHWDEHVSWEDKAERALRVEGQLAGQRLVSRFQLRDCNRYFDPIESITMNVAFKRTSMRFSGWATANAAWCGSR